jgi:hypothetical protein
LNQLQQYLDGIGTIHIDQTRNRVIYSIDSIKELTKLFVHLDNCPLLTQKAADLILFKQVVSLMNKGLSDMLKSEFKEYSPVKRPLINTENIPDPY